MPKITYVTFEGREFVVDAAEGLSLMEAAVKNAVPGIEADCGGACACATCHVYVDEPWLGRLADPTTVENAMLEFVEAAEVNSRLACQLSLTQDLDGLVVRLPKSQH